MIDALLHMEGTMSPGEAAPTLFLDRDGVINVRPMGPGAEGYVKSWEEFEFLPGVLETLAELTAWRVVVVTNQRGVSRGFMTLQDVRGVHLRLIEEVAEAGGRVDAAYCCPDMDGPDRKPEPGMLLRSIADHPGIDASRSVIVGDSATDLMAGAAVGVRGVLVGTDELRRDEREQLIDAGLRDFIEAVSLPDARQRLATY